MHRIAIRLAMLVALTAVAGCATKKEPTKEELTTATELGGFGPRSPAQQGAAPGGFGQGPSSGSIFGDGSGAGAGSAETGVFADGSGAGTGGIFNGAGQGTGAPVFDGNGSLSGIGAGTTGTFDANGNYIGPGTGAGGGVFADGGLGAGSLGGYQSGGVLDGQSGLGGGLQYDDQLFDTSSASLDQSGGSFATAGGAASLGGISFGPGDDGSSRFFVQEVGDTVRFGTDSAQLDVTARELLRRQAAWLQLHPEVAVTLEGHADERGPRSYNLALGARRANAARSYLTSLGVGVDRVRTVSYGKERPFAVGSNEASWAQNRRVVTVLRGAASF